MHMIIQGIVEAKRVDKLTISGSVCFLTCLTTMPAPPRMLLPRAENMAAVSQNVNLTSISRSHTWVSVVATVSANCCHP